MTKDLRFNRMEQLVLFLYIYLYIFLLAQKVFCVSSRGFTALAQKVLCVNVKVFFALAPNFFLR